MRPFCALMTCLILMASPALAVDSPRPGETSSTDSGSRRVSLVFVNDIHAQIEPHPELFWSGDREEFVKDVGGLSRIATVFNRLRAERSDELVFIDGGDTIQGSGPAAWTQGQVVIEPMNALGLDFAIPGNWSVAYGTPAWKAAVEGFQYPMIAANVRDEATGELVHEPYLIKEVNGARVGFIGFTDPDIPTRQPPQLSKGLAFDDLDVLPKYIAEVREKHEVDLVVLVTHIGLPKAVGLADSIEGVDIILSADTHERTYEPIIRGDIWVVEAGSFASFVGILDIVLDDQGAIVDRAWRLIELRPELFPEDPEVKQIVADALAPHRERMNREIGRTDVWLARYEVLNTSLDRLITDAIQEASGSEVALSNGYRFAPPTAPGPITEADLWNWLPISLELKTGKATGDQLRQYWESELQSALSDDPDQLFGGWLTRAAGMTVDFERQAPSGKRLHEVLVSGEPLEGDRLYSVCAGYRLGAPADSIHRVRGCQNIKLLGISTHDAVEKYLQHHSPIRSVGIPRVRCVDQPGLHLHSQILDKLKGSSR